MVRFMAHSAKSAGENVHTSVKWSLGIELNEKKKRPFTTGSHSLRARALVDFSSASSSRRERAFISDGLEDDGPEYKFSIEVT
jgi:hypothetical protein